MSRGPLLDLTSVHGSHLAVCGEIRVQAFVCVEQLSLMRKLAWWNFYAWLPCVSVYTACFCVQKIGDILETVKFDTVFCEFHSLEFTRHI